MAEAAPALMAFSSRSNEPLFDTIRRCVAALQRGERTPPADCAKLQRRYPEPLRTNLLVAASDPQYWRAFLSTFQSLKLDSKQVMNPKRNYGAMPMVVLHAGVFAFPTAPADAQRDAPAARAVIKAGHDALALLSTRGTMVTVEGSAHWIAGQKPDAVVRAVDKMVEGARATDAPLHR